LRAVEVALNDLDLIGERASAGQRATHRCLASAAAYQQGGLVA
jgi:hypothetical protein